MSPHPYHDLDTYKEAIPVIPALTRGWRIGCALRFMLTFGVIVFALAIYFVSNRNPAEQGNPVALLSLDPWAFFLPQAGIFILTVVVYDLFSVKFYRWWFSRGRDH
jgi:hypothetical protein